LENRFHTNCHLPFGKNADCTRTVITRHSLLQEVTATDENGKVQKYTLDAGGKLVGRTRLEGTLARLTRYERDVLGRIVQVKDPALNTWSYGFDPLGNRTSVSDPDLGTWSYAFDKASRLVSQTDAKGQVTTLGYDGLSRVTSKTVTNPGK
jgi:YD repeat-containing protein